MANTVTSLSYANTFGDWLVATSALIRENNVLAANDYTKNSGTLYLNETTQNSLQANGTVVIQKELRVQGTGSSVTIDRNTTVGGQVYFTNATLGLTHTGQANLNGLVLVQGPGIGISVSNSAYVGGNTTIVYNTTTNNLQANSSVNTSNISIVNSALANYIQGNTKILTGILTANNNIYTDILQSNTSITTTTLQANNVVNTSIVSASSVLTDTFAANSSANINTLYANTITVNNSVSIPTLSIGTKLDGNSASGYFNSMQVQGGGLTVNGNFVLTGTTVYASNTFQLSTGATSGISSYLQVARGSSGANAAIRWNELQSYWDMLNVSSNTYYRILTNEYISDSLNSTSTTSVASSAAANTLNNQLTSANTFLQAAVIAAGSYANSAYASQNTTGIYANSAYTQANTATNNAAGASLYANAAFARANAAYTTFNGTTGSFTSNTISFASNNGLTITSTGSNTLSISTSQDLRTTGSPTFASLTLTAPLSAAYGGTGATSTAGALTALLPTGTTAGYVLTTGGPGNFYWSAASGGGGGVTPGTTINSTRLSYVANTNGQQTFATPTFTTSTQLRAYIDGVRQFESEYSSNTSNATISFTTAPASGQNILIEVDGYYVNPYYANNITFTAPQGSIPSSANTIQLAINDLESRKAALAGATYTGVAAGLTLDANTSNTAFATTAFVKNVLNSGNTFSLSISGVAASASVVANTGITGTITAAQLGTTSNPQFASVGVGTAADSANTGSIRATNNITAYYSDENLKTKLGDIENPVEKVMSLHGFYYEANETAQALGYSVKREVGLSAQEVQRIMPEIVVPAPIDDRFLTIHYDRLIPLLVEAIKELKQEIDTLKGTKQ